MNINVLKVMLTFDVFLCTCELLVLMLKHIYLEATYMAYICQCCMSFLAINYCNCMSVVTRFCHVHKE